MKRCALHAGHAGRHLFIATKAKFRLLGECDANPRVVAQLRRHAAKCPPKEAA